MIVIDIDFTTKQISATTTNDLTLGTGGGGAGGGVESVTGDLVNNTDPLNPIVNTPSLNEVLAENNETDGEDILITDGDKILLDNGANLKKGTTDAGLGGSKGIALRCAVDYELKWEAGRLYVMGGDGFTIREVSHNFTTTPTVNDDNTKGFIIGSRWILDDGTTYECTDASLGTAVWVAITAGTVTSVGLTMPSAFTVANSPITSSGDIAVTGAGLVSQYVRGDGSLANFPASTGGGASQSFYLNGSVSQGTFGGVAFKEMDRVPILGAGTDFTINTNGYIQSFITDANVPNLLEIPAGNWNFETYFSASSGGGSPSFYLELYKWNGTTLSLIASNSATPEGITGGTAIDLYISALAVPQTALLATDRLAIRIYVNNSGRTITLHTENNRLCQVITTFSTGITALNGLTDQVQNLSVGTSGTDFAISSATGTHTFNLPTASAANRGALSSADWTTFNGKQDTLVSGTNIRTVNGNTLLGSTDLVISASPSGLTGQIQFNNGGAFGADSNLFWDNTNKRLGIGATPASTVRLDVRAQGNLSTDIPFRIRNVFNNDDIVTVQATGRVFFRTNNYAFDFFISGGSGGCYLNAHNGVLFLNANSTTDSQLVVRSSSGNKCVDIGGTGLGTGTNKLAFLNGTAPSTNLTDAFQQYSADIVAGNAAPHFRTENGNVIKLYRETTAVVAGAFVANTSAIVDDSATYGGYTMGQVVAALKAQGLLA
jgi:hypothetical protein